LNDEDYIERNYQLLQNKMIEEMELALDFGKKLVDSELDAGILDFLVKPIIKSFYNYWSVHDARTGTLEQIRVTLDSAKNLVKNGYSKEDFNRIVEQNFPIYLENDQTFKQCKRTHKNFQKLKEVTKETFISQIQESIEFLNIKQDVKDYDELVRVTFESKEEAYKSLITQLNFNDECIKIVEKDSSILKIPTGKNMIIKILRKGFIQTKKYLLDGLDEIY
jgi:hypothetical protein